MSFNITGLETLEQKVSDKKSLVKVKAVIRKCTADLDAEMQRQAHFGRYELKNPKRFSTGALRQSITMSIENGGLQGRVGPDVTYAGFVEYGTRFMTAEPYLRPAVNVIKPEFIKYLKEIV